MNYPIRLTYGTACRTQGSVMSGTEFEMFEERQRSNWVRLRMNFVPKTGHFIY